MIKTKSVLFPPDLDHIYLIPISDTHIGDPAGLGGSSEEGRYATTKFSKMVTWIKNTPEAYAFLMGDIFDAVTKTSLGNVYEQEYNIKTAKEYASDVLSPIKDKILGAISGNHEDRIERAVGENPVENWSEHFGIDYFPNWCAYFFLKIGEARTGKRDRRRPIVYTMFLHHITGGGRTKGGKLNRVAYLKEMALADLYCGAHVHLKGAFKGKYIYGDMNNYKIREQQQTYVATGSYMGYAGYSIRGQYDKPSTGSPRIRMNGEPIKGKDIHVSI